MPGEKRSEEYDRFYQSLQREIEMYLDQDGVYKPKDQVIQGKIRNYLLLIPNLFLLLYNLLLDKRVSTENKAVLTVAIAYFISPLDVLPEIFLGALGYLDDLAIVFLALDRILNHTPLQVVRENWRGEEDILLLIQQGLENVQNFFDQVIWRKIKQLFDKKSTR